MLECGDDAADASSPQDVDAALADDGGRVPEVVLVFLLIFHDY